MPTECPIWKINSVSHLSQASLTLVFTDAAQSWPVVAHQAAAVDFSCTTLSDVGLAGGNPDDILGHTTIQGTLKDNGISVATGEHPHNQSGGRGHSV